MSRPTDPFDPDPESVVDDDDEMYERREGRGDKGSRVGLSDFVRRTLDSVSNTGTVSREAIQYVVQQGEKGRKEVLRIFANEVGSFLKNTDLSREVTKILTSVQMDFNASVRFKAVDGGRDVQPDIEPHLKVKLGRDDDDAEVEHPVDDEPPAEAKDE